MTIKRIIRFALLAIIASGILAIIICNSYIGFRTKHLEEKNPTSYVYHMPINRLKSLIENDFSKNRSKGGNDLESVQEISRKSWFVKNANSSSYSRVRERVFEKPGNKYDFYLIPCDNPIISYSKIYMKFWNSLEYFAEFQLHFTVINENETKVDVITHGSKVLYFSFPVFSGHAYVNEKKVEPTSIEEYEILLRIGKLVGEKDMPPLKLPK